MYIYIYVYGLALAAVAVDSVEARLPQIPFGRPLSPWTPPGKLPGSFLDLSGAHQILWIPPQHAIWDPPGVLQEPSRRPLGSSRDPWEAIWEPPGALPMEFLMEFLKDFLKEFRRETTASEIPEEASCVQSLALLNAPRPGGGFGRSPLDNYN